MPGLPSTLCPLSRRGASLAVVALALFFAPQVAWGECGSHVRIRGEKGAAAQDRAPLPKAQNPAPIKLPCHGPHCSRSSERMPPAPPVAPPTFAEQWGSLPALPGAGPVTSAQHQAGESQVRAVHRAFPPERPPRPGISPVG